MKGYKDPKVAEVVRTNNEILVTQDADFRSYENLKVVLLIDFKVVKYDQDALEQVFYFLDDKYIDSVVEVTFEKEETKYLFY